MKRGGRKFSIVQALNFVKGISDQKTVLDINGTSNISLLHVICWVGDHRRLYKMLGEAKFFDMVNTADSNGWTPLHWAAGGSTRGHIECAQYLLRAKAIIDKKSNTGDSPLSISVMKGRLPMVKFLVEQGANLHERNVNDDTPFDVAMRLNRRDMCHILQWGGMHVMARSAMRRGKFMSLINTWQKPALYILFLFALSK